MRRVTPSGDSAKQTAPIGQSGAPANPVLSPEIAQSVQRQSQSAEPAPAPVQATEIPLGQQAAKDKIQMQQVDPVVTQSIFNNQTTSTGTKMSLQKPSLARHSNPSPINRMQSSAAMDNIRKAIEELGAAPELDGLSLTMLELDRNGGNRNLGALIVCVTERANNKTAVAFHTLLLEETGQAKTVRRRMDSGAEGYGTANGGVFEYPLYPSDGYDGYMREAVVLAVAKKFGNGQVITDNEKKTMSSGNVVLLDAMASTVPATLDLTKPANVRGAVSNGSVAASTILRTYLGLTDDFKLDGDVSGQRWTSSILVSDAAFTDMMGIPMCGDVVLELREGGSDSNNSNNQTFNDPAGEVLTHQILGFQDFAYDPSPAAQMAQMNGTLMSGMNLGMGMGMGVGVDPTAYLTFRSRYVITNLDPIWNPTLPDTLMGLATTQLLAEDRRFQSLHIKRHMLGAQNPIGGKNLHDLGALGLEVLRPGTGDQAGQMVRARFATTGAKGEEPILMSILNSVVHPDPVVSMDISETGTFSWIHGVFASAALGSPSSNEDIVGAADYLTRGKFSQIYAQECKGNPLPVMVNDGVLVNLGRYNDANGQLRDVREVNQLVIENAFGETAPEMVSRWIRMNYDRSLNEEFRLVEMKEIISQLYASVQFTGRARRVTFRPEFLRALNLAIAACGGRFMVRWGNEAPQSTARATASFLSNLGYNSAASGAFVQGYRPQATGLGMTAGNQSFGRWFF